MEGTTGQGDHVWVLVKEEVRGGGYRRKTEGDYDYEVKEALDVFHEGNWPSPGTHHLGRGILSLTGCSGIFL